MRSAPAAGQVAHADQVVSCKRQKRLPGKLGSTDQLGFAQTAHGFQPTEAFLDPFALPLADSVALMAGGPTVDRTAGALTRHMRCDTQVTATFHEVAGVVAFVGTDGAARLGVTQQQFQCFGAFGGAVGLGQRDVHDEAVAALGQNVGHMA